MPSSLRRPALIAAITVALGGIVPYASSLWGLVTFLSSPNHQDVKPAEIFYVLILPLASIILVPFFYAMVAVEAAGRTGPIPSRAAAILSACIGSLGAALVSLYLIEQGTVAPQNFGLLRILTLAMPAFLLSYGLGMSTKILKGLALFLAVVLLIETVGRALNGMQWFQAVSSDPRRPWEQNATGVTLSGLTLLTALLATAAQVYFFWTYSKGPAPEPPPEAEIATPV
jgi:hypothetical protein